MQWFVITLFLTVTLASFTVTSLGAPRLFKYLPELLSVAALLYVLIVGMRRRFDLIAPKYWVLFGALVLVIVCGIATNGVGPGPVLSGTRFYIRALPFFFLPAVCDFTETQMHQQLKWLTWISLLQLPMSIYQRWRVLSEMRWSGDDVIGTLQASGILSIFVICAALVATGLFLRGRIGTLRYTCLLLLLLIPTTINETKATVIYLPLGLLIVFVVGATPGRRWIQLGWAAGILLVFSALFVPVYKLMLVYSPASNDTDIVDFFTDQKKLSHYLASNAKGVGTKKDIRRGDAINVTVDYLEKDPIRLALGIGIGSASPSQLGPAFEGDSHALFGGFLNLSFTYFLLETGVLGMGLILLLHWLVFRDSLELARLDHGIAGAFAIGWSGVVALMALSLFYVSIHLYESVTYLYWYFAGYVAAQRVARSREAHSMPGPA